MFQGSWLMPRLVTSKHCIHMTIDAICLQQEEWLRCSPVLALQQNLGLERQAAFSFCYTWFDEVLPDEHVC